MENAIRVQAEIRQLGEDVFHIELTQEEINMLTPMSSVDRQKWAMSQMSRAKRRILQKALKTIAKGAITL